MSVDLSRLTTVTIVSGIGTMTDTTVDLSGIESCPEFGIHGCPNLLSVDISANTIANNITIEFNTAMTSVVIGTLPLCSYFNGQSCAFDQTTVDNILVAIAANGLEATVLLTGGANAAPSATGLAAKATIEGNGGTVYVNP